MPTRQKIVIISITVFLTIFIVFMIKFSNNTKSNNNCPFCDRKVINYQKYFEDSSVIGLCSYRPLYQGHCLIIPKRHVERFEDLSDIEQNEMLGLVRKTHLAVKKTLNARNYFLLQKNGKSAGQTVPHVHIHYIPVSENKSGLMILMKFLFYPFGKKISENQMHQMTSSISESI